MDLIHLRYFVAVAEERHFTAAAAKVGAAQSTVSWAVSKLEGELGVVLFQRTSRSVELSAHGRAFLPAARRVLEELDAGVAAFSAQAPGRERQPTRAQAASDGCGSERRG